eukprot:754519-Hanusia_phi.AAC.2
MVVVGFNPDEKKYQRPICRVSTGAVSDLVELPALQNGGCNAFIHFDAKSPPGWKSGALYIKVCSPTPPSLSTAFSLTYILSTEPQGETKKFRNPEGEAIAQWSDADLNFSDEKAMIGKRMPHWNS